MQIDQQAFLASNSKEAEITVKKPGADYTFWFARN
jgi:hypothetical protein